MFAGILLFSKLVFSKPVRGRSEWLLSSSKLFRFVLINSRHFVSFSCSSETTRRPSIQSANSIDFAFSKRNLALQTFLFQVFIYVEDDNIDYPCKRRLCLSLLLHRISFFLFFPSQQKACAHAKPAGVPPIFELADRTIFTRDKCTRVAQNSPQRRIIIGVITAVFHRYSFSSVFIRSGYHPLSLFLSSTTLNVNASRKYIRFSNIFPIPRIDFVFFFSPPLPSGREQQTRAYLLLPRLKSIFAITRPVHGNSDSTPVFT